MDFSNIKVLVIDSAGKQPYAMVRGLKDIGCHVTVLCTSKLDPCYVSNKPDMKILNREIAANEDIKLNYLQTLLSNGQFDVMMPIGEASTDFVTRNEATFAQYVRLACAPRNIYIKAYDKQITFDQAIESGIPCPLTRHSSQSIDDFLSKAKFPIIIKPRNGIGSIGFHKFNSESEFRTMLSDNNFDINDYVLQEFVNFENRIGTNLFIDPNGNVCTAYAVDVLRWFPLDAGAGVLIHTVNAHKELEYAARLLKDLGWQGFANVAFMIEKETGNPLLMEINGRIPASIKMSYECGFNISRQFIEMVYGNNVTRYPENTKFGKYLRHLDTDVAWFLKSPSRFRTQPSWFSWGNTVEALFSRDDPKPFFSQFMQKMFSYRKIMRAKKH